MGIDIVAERSDGSTVVSKTVFRHDGVYWFLHPLFEKLAKSHGKYIDLYGDAVFAPGEIDIFVTLLDRADSLAAKAPRQIKVHIGTQIRPERRDIFDNIQRTQLIDILKVKELRGIADLAKAERLTIRFYGD